MMSSLVRDGGSSWVGFLLGSKTMPVEGQASGGTREGPLLLRELFADVAAQISIAALTSETLKVTDPTAEGGR